jgi:hypothetical protein
MSVLSSKHNFISNYLIYRIRNNLYSLIKNKDLQVNKSSTMNERKENPYLWSRSLEYGIPNCLPPLTYLSSEI